MSKIIGGMLTFLFGGNAYISTLIISMFPLIELKGAIPIGMSVDFFGDKALGGIQAFLLALTGSSIVIFILPLVFRPILNFFKRTKLFKSLGEYIENKVGKHSTDILAKKKSTFFKCLAMFMFVALPLPLTGVWMGCCVSVAIDLDYWQTVFSVFFGNVCAGLIIYFVCSIFPAFTTILVYIVLGIIAAILIVGIIRKIIKRKKAIKE